MRPVSISWLVCVLVLGTKSAWGAPELPALSEGFLCCNMQLEEGWISDINYRTPTSQQIPAGAPIRVTGYGRHLVKLIVAGKAMELGNDYSRKVNLRDFAQRYVLEQDAVQRMAAWSPEVREAVRSARVVRDMDREQVLMVLGYPIADATPDLSAVVWKYYVDGERPFDVVFDPAGKVFDVRGEDTALAVVAPWLLTPERLAQANAGERACTLNVYHAMAKHWNTARDRVYVYVDDRSRGTIGRGDAVCIDLDPGRHTVAIRNTFNFIPMPFKTHEHVIDVQAGGAPVFLRWEKVITGVNVVGPTAGMPLTASNLDLVVEQRWRDRD